MFTFGNQARKRLNRSRRRSDHRAEQKYRPRLEHLEGRALPSVSRLAIDIPVMETFGNSTINLSLIVRVDFSTYSIFGNGVGLGGGFYNAGSVTARPALTSQVANGTVPNVDPVSSAASLRAAPLLTDTASASLASFTNAVATSATSNTAGANLTNRPILVKPSLPELRFSQMNAVSALTDASLLQAPTLPPDFTKILAPDLRLLAPVNPPVQAIVNRMEFIGGSSSSADDATDPAEAPLFPAPAPQPVVPPPVDSGALAPTAAAVDAALAGDAWLIEKSDLGMLASQESDAQTLLTPEVVSEVAALAIGLAGFSVGSPADYFPGCEVQRRLHVKTLANKWKNLLWGPR